MKFDALDELVAGMAFIILGVGYIGVGLTILPFELPEPNMQKWLYVFGFFKMPALSGSIITLAIFVLAGVVLIMKVEARRSEICQQ